MKRLDTGGVTLSETMLAAAILTFALSACLSLFINSNLLNENCRSSTAAAVHAQYILEDIKNTEFDQVASGISAWNLDSDDLASEPYNFFTLSNESIRAEIFQAGDPLGVAVNVTWADSRGRSRSAEFRTLLTE